MTWLSLSLAVNCLIVFPVSWAMLRFSPGIDTVFGTDSDARRILASVYLAIGLLSAAGLGAAMLGYGPQIRGAVMGLLVLQIVYKLITTVTVGLASPVVITNLAVVALHSVTLWMVARP